MKSRRDGFTLVELVVVIAVIAILAAILVPTIASVLENAKRTVDVQQMRSVNVMLLLGEIDKSDLRDGDYALQTNDRELAYSVAKNDVVIVELADNYLDDIIVEAENSRLKGENAKEYGYIRVSMLDDGNEDDPNNPDGTGGGGGQTEDPNGGDENKDQGGGDDNGQGGTTEPEKQEWDFIIKNDDELKDKKDEIAKKDQEFTVYLEDAVTDLKNYFTENKFLTRIYLGKGITEIPYRAFYNCILLDEVIIGGVLTNIEDEAFRYCDCLTNIELPLGLTKIGDSAFKYCKALEKLVIPESVKEIGAQTFYMCNFTHLSLPCVEIMVKEDSMGNSIEDEIVITTVEHLIISGGAMENEDKFGSEKNNFTTWLGLLLGKSTKDQNFEGAKKLKSLTVRNVIIGKADPFSTALKNVKIEISIDKYSYDSIAINNALKSFFADYVPNAEQQPKISQ